MYMYIVTSFMKESWHLVNMIHIPIQNNNNKSKNSSYYNDIESHFQDIIFFEKPHLF